MLIRIWKYFVVVALASVPAVFGQSTAFTYQGRLVNATNPANGIYDLRFGLYDSAAGPLQVTSMLTNSTVTVSNGLMTALVDFGSAAFDGSDRWLEVGVRSNGVGAFVTLSPRQRITAAPYALRAQNYSGGILDAQLSTNVALLDAPQVFSGPVRFSNLENRFSGTFVGDGSGMTNMYLQELNSPLLTRPAMGIANWLDYWNQGLGQEPGEDVATNAILKMVANGLVASGREWLRIDYGWAAGHTGPNGTLTGNSNKFPHGIQWLVQYAHDRGVKIDLAISYPLETSLTQIPGDIRTMMSWGVDGICVLTDIGAWPTNPTYDALRTLMHISYQAMLDANGTPVIGDRPPRGVPLTFSVNYEPVWRVPPETAIVANTLYVQPGFIYYAAHDMADWARKYFLPFDWYGRAGHYAHANTIRWQELSSSTNNFRMWSQLMCLASAGFWTTTTTADLPEYLKYMTNRELNSLWFDPAGIVGHVAYSNSYNEVWVRPLGANNSKTNLVLLLNTATNGNANVTVTAAQLGVSSNSLMRVRDPMNGVNVTTFTGAWTSAVGQADMALYHIFPAPEAVAVIGDGRGLTNLPNGIVASGVATLGFGTNRVVTSSANATNRFLLTYRSLNGSLATIGLRNIEANTAFTIISQNNADTNQVDWAIIKP